MTNKKALVIASISCLALLAWLPQSIHATEYAYNNLNRLVDVTHDDGTTQHFTYDEVGNRLTREVVGLTQGPNIVHVLGRGPKGVWGDRIEPGMLIRLVGSGISSNWIQRK